MLTRQTQEVGKELAGLQQIHAVKAAKDAFRNNVVKLQKVNQELQQENAHL